MSSSISSNPGGKKPAKKSDQNNEPTVKTLLEQYIELGKNTPRKYLIGNNGNFNFFDPNVFRVLTPLTGFSYVYSGYNNK